MIGLVALAVAIELPGLIWSWRLIHPPWKRLGKPAFYLGASAGLAWWVGPWALVFIVGHPLLGYAVHIWFCRQHGFHPVRVAWENPEAYVARLAEAEADGSAGGDS